MIEQEKKLEGLVQGIPQAVKLSEMKRSNPKPDFKQSILDIKQLIK